MEINIKIPKVPCYQEDVLLLVIPNSIYGHRVPVQIGTKVIGKVMSVISPEELEQADKAWQIAYFSMVTANKISTTDSKTFSATKLNSDIVTTKLVKVLPFESTEVKGLTKIKGHSKRINLIVEAPDKVFTVTNTYMDIKLGSSSVGVCVHNMSAHTIEILAHIQW